MRATTSLATSHGESVVAGATGAAGAGMQSGLTSAIVEDCMLPSHLDDLLPPQSPGPPVAISTFLCNFFVNFYYFCYFSTLPFVLNKNFHKHCHSARCCRYGRSP